MFTPTNAEVTTGSTDHIALYLVCDCIFQVLKLNIVFFTHLLLHTHARVDSQLSKIGLGHKLSSLYHCTTTIPRTHLRTALTFLTSLSILMTSKKYFFGVNLPTSQLAPGTNDLTKSIILSEWTIHFRNSSPIIHYP